MCVTDENVNLVVGVTQNISSPNYPYYYHNNAFYEWYIRAPSGYDVLIHFIDFRTEQCCDHLRIGSEDSPSSPGSVVLVHLSGTALPSDIRFV